MNLEYLHYFLTILECGSLNKAATQLYISKPSLRTAIDTLEKELTAPLIERTKSGCIPTEFGKQVASEAHIMFDCVEHWKQLAITGNNENKPISIISTRPFCDVVLTPLATKIQQKYPSVTLTIGNANGEDTLTAIQKGQCNIGIICGYSDDFDKIQAQLPSSNWTITKICNDRFMAIVNTKNPLAQQDSISLEELNQYSRLALTHTEHLPSPHADLSAFLNAPTLYINSHVNAFQIIAEDPAYYVLFTVLLQQSSSYVMYQDKICFKPVNNLPGNAEFYLIAQKDANLSPSERLVINMIHEYCKNIEMYNGSVI